MTRAVTKREVLSRSTRSPDRVPPVNGYHFRNVVADGASVRLVTAIADAQPGATATTRLETSRTMVTGTHRRRSPRYGRPR